MLTSPDPDNHCRDLKVPAAKAAKPAGCILEATWRIPAMRVLPPLTPLSLTPMLALAAVDLPSMIPLPLACALCQAPGLGLELGLLWLSMRQFMRQPSTLHSTTPNTCPVGHHQSIRQTGTAGWYAASPGRSRASTARQGNGRITLPVTLNTSVLHYHPARPHFAFKQSLRLTSPCRRAVVPYRRMQYLHAHPHQPTDHPLPPTLSL